MVCKGDFQHLTESEIGSRPPKESTLHKFISVVAFCWSLFQVWVASPLQFEFAQLVGSNAVILSDLQIRSVHLSVGIFLVFLLFPARERSPCDRVPINDWIFAIMGSAAVFCVCLFYSQISLRLGLPTNADVMFALIGIALLLEASRRTVGFAIMTIASLFLLYSKFGEVMPDIIMHKNYSFDAIASHQWFSLEGVFGTALGVSADFVFLYVLFGALLEKTGAGEFFIQLSFALLGRFRGGPAKAAVVSSGMMGMISGSSIANTITVGSLTIPLMKKMGFSAEKAAAIEVSAGVNGQIMPPVMGAAAFLMAEYLSIPYVEVIKHAFLPAVLIYVALLYIVHIEACKLDLKPTNVGSLPPLAFRLFRALGSSLAIIVFFGFVYLFIEGIGSFVGVKHISDRFSTYVLSAVCVVVYFMLLRYQDTTRLKSLASSSLEDATPLFILRCGLHHFLPLAILIWCLLIEHLSPALSAYRAILFLLFELATKDLILSIFAKEPDIKKNIKLGLIKCADAMVMGAKNMTVVSIATATAGVIVGSVALTGVGLKISGILDYFASGNLFITLILTAVVCIILGMGMPTTACYIIVATLMVPVLQYITEKNAMQVPVFAMHLFVFYFGLMADVTPPVGLASYAASAIAKSNAIGTGIQAFLYNIRTMILPFLFMLDPRILLFDVNGVYEVIQILFFSTLGIIAITSGTQGYFVIKSKIYESFLLVAIGVCMICPQIPINILTPPFDSVEMRMDPLSYKNQKSKLQVVIDEKDFFGRNETVKLNVDTRKTQNQTIKEQLEDCGLLTRYNKKDGSVDVLSILHHKDPHCSKIDTSAKIKKISIAQDQLSVYGPYLVSLAVFIFIFLMQKRRC